MKKYISLILIISFCITFSPLTFAKENSLEIHVSSDGNDSNEGTINSPVKTLECARNIYRKKVASGSFDNGEILIHGGVYRMSESLVLSSEDNGMTIRSYGDGEVLLRGSVELSKNNFSKTTDSEFLERLPEESVGKIYEYNLGNVISGDMDSYPDYTPLQSGTAYYELFSGGMPQNIARWPNVGYTQTGNVFSDGLTFEVDSDRLEKWKNADDGMVCGYLAHNWSFENIRIKSVDAENSTITLARNLVYGNNVLKSKNFYVINMPEEMDMPGEYYIDYKEKMLYYYPSKYFLEENPELSVLKGSMIRINGASDITISGITFEYTRGIGISAGGGKNITVDECVLRNIGGFALSLEGFKNNVKNCEIYNIGSGGVYINSGTNVSRIAGESIVKNNNIYNFGRIFRTYQPGIFLAGFGNVAEYNTIHDAPHCAVRFTGSEHKISHNEIYGVVLECSDSSAIYCGRNWSYWGNEISYNYFHDIKKNVDNDVYTVSAIYMDDMLCGTKVSNNYFENCSRAIFFGGGKGNVITDNTVVDCEEAIDYDERAVTGEWAHSGVISGGETYEKFLTFISDNNLDIDVWKEKYDGFTELLEDVKAYQTDVTAGNEIVEETGYPKNVTITGNRYYGGNVNDKSYIYISKYVPDYGTVSDNEVSEVIPEISLPESGAEEKLWSTEFYVVEPEESKVFEYGDIDFTWMRAGGADTYEISVYDEDGNVVLIDETTENGYNLKLLEKGKYSWTVTAKSGEKTITENGELVVRKDSLNKGTLIAGNDFDEIDSLIRLKNMGWDYEVSGGDKLTLEKDSEGNGYLRFERNENNLYNTTATFAKLTFPEKTSGKITVTYDIKIDNLRGGWRDMGSLQTSSGNADIVRMLTHEKYFYGVQTGGAVTDRIAQDMTKLSCDSYVTIKRTVDLDNNTYDLWIYQDGKEFRYAKDYKCPDGNAGSVLFRLGYQSPFKPFEGTGNAVYRIDNVYVDMGELSPEYTYPVNDAENVDVNDKIRIKWNDKLKTDTVTKDNVIVYENECEISKESYSLNVDEKNIYINFDDGMNYGSEYRVEVLNTVMPDSLSHVVMAEKFELNFKTQKKEQYVYYAQGFEEEQADELSDDFEVNVAEGDSVTIENDAFGNRALKFVRNKNNLESNKTSCVKMKFKPIEKGVVTVSFDVRIENYRGGIKNLATVRDRGSNVISSLFTHSKWMYGMNTNTGYNFQIDTVKNDTYLTVKRKIDTENGVYSIWIYKDGELISSKSQLPCGTGEMSEIIFEMGYQPPYTVSDGDEDAIYWIDNIRIDTDVMGVYITEPQDNSIGNSVSEIKAIFNCDIDEKTVGYDTVKVYRYSNLLPSEKYDIFVSGNVIKIILNSETNNGEGCTVRFSQNIMPLNSLHITKMYNEYVFSFDTNIIFNHTETICEDVLKINIESNIKNYICIVAEHDSYGTLINLHTMECDQNELLELKNKENLVVYFWDSISAMNPLCEPFRN